MPDQTDFKQTQYAFAAAIRDPEKNPAPDGIDPVRMQVYQELFYNNVEDFLSSTFPVLQEILGEDKWHALVRDYFSTHHARTPLFMQMPYEFIVYLQDERGTQPEDPHFLLPLAHYEWVELALATSNETIDPETIDIDGDLLEGRPIISPLAWVLVYDYAVHLISVDYQPAREDTRQTCLIVYRDSNDDVQFIEINDVTARLLGLIEQERRPAREILEQIAHEIGSPEPEVVVQAGLDTLRDLHQRGVILGIQKS